MEAITNLATILGVGLCGRQRRHAESVPEVQALPHTLSYRPLLIEGLISNERLSSYQRVFHPADDVELMGAYLWNAHVCSALYPLISMVEIVLRNSIDHALTRHLGAFWWSGTQLRYRSHAPGAPTPRSVQTLLKLVHPESLRLLDVNGLLQTAHRACTSDEIRRFQHLMPIQRIDTIDTLSESVDRCVSDNRVITATLLPGQDTRFLIMPR